jgi:CBS domain containing-hemolysin-like protein
MRAWTDVTTVTEDVSPAMVEVLATRTGRSRFPMVHRETRRVMGFVHVKDVLGVSGPQRLGPMSDGLVRQLPVVGPDHTLAELLIAMRRERQHIVLVSQAGTPLGVLTLYDVLGVIAPMPPVVIKSSRDSAVSTG